MLGSRKDIEVILTKVVGKLAESARMRRPPRFPMDHTIINNLVDLAMDILRGCEPYVGGINGRQMGRGEVNNACSCRMGKW